MHAIIVTTSWENTLNHWNMAGEHTFLRIDNLSCYSFEHIFPVVHSPWIIIAPFYFMDNSNEYRRSSQFQLFALRNIRMY